MEELNITTTEGHIVEHSRFMGFPWYSSEKRSTLVGGAGGIGSWLSFFLCRAGFDIHLFDDDTVDTHNLSGQLFKTSHIGQLKVLAVSRILQEYTDEVVNCYSTKVTEETMYSKYTFSAFDNMLARKTLFNIWKRRAIEGSVYDSPIFIDGRLDGEQMQIFCVTKNNIEEYEKFLFDDSEVPDTACTIKQTTHSAAMIASHMFGFFTNHLSNLALEEQVREVPFYFEYVIPFNLTETW